jgi:hypothetical protein
MKKNEFINSATETIKEVIQTMEQRGSEYSDSWGTEGVWLLTKAVLQKYTDVTPTEEMCKAIGLAVFIDQKYSRFIGGYKRDTAIDMVSYIAALANKVTD